MRVSGILLFCSGLFLSGCSDEAAPPQNNWLPVEWCDAQQATRVEIHLQSNSFADYAIVQEGDLTYPIDFCDFTRTCISAPIQVAALDSVRASGDWCTGPVCFELISDAHANTDSSQLRWIAARHIEFETQSRFALSETGEVARLTWFGTELAPCQ